MITRREFVKGVAGVAVAGSLMDVGNKENLVAACGLYCGACPMYLATQTKDDSKIKALQQQFGAGKTKLAAEDLLCDGCLGGGRLASFCRACAIRDCAAKKASSKRCSDCSEFACSRITGFNNDGMLHHGEVLENLRQLKTMGIKNWAKHEEDRWRCPQCQAAIAWYDPACSKCGTKRSERLFPLKRA